MSAEAGSPLLGLLSLAVLMVATLSTDIAANIVAPADSISALSPRRIDFRTGGMIAGLIGIAILPWKLRDMHQGWLISCVPVRLHAHREPRRVDQRSGAAEPPLDARRLPVAVRGEAAFCRVVAFVAE